MEYNQLVARFFATRVGMLTNSKRIIVITEHRFLAYDETDQIKENHPLVDLAQISPSKAKDIEFTLSWEGGTKETYLCDQRNALISVIIKQMEVEKGLMADDRIVKYTATEKTRSREDRPVVLVVGLASLFKMDNQDTSKVRSFKYLTDLIRIIKFQKNEEQHIELQFTNGTWNDYILKPSDRPNFIAALRKSLVDSVTKEIIVEELSYDDILRMRMQRETQLMEGISSNIVVEAVVNQISKRKEQAPKPRVFSITPSHILVCNYDPENFVNIQWNKANATTKYRTIYFAATVESIVRIRMNYTVKENGMEDLRFMLELNTGKVVEFESPQREILIATIMEVARWKGTKCLDLMYTPYAPGYKVGPLGVNDFRMENINYFLKRASNLNDKSEEADIVFIVNEWSHNIPIIEPTIKDRRLIHTLFSLLKWKISHKESTSESRRTVVVTVLSAIHRCIAFKGSIDEVMRDRDKLPLLIALLKSSDSSISNAAAGVLHAIIVTTSMQNAKTETWLKDTLFTDENIAGILALLLRSVQERINSLLISTLSAIFESAITSPTSSKELSKKLNAKFMDLMEMLFGLCRYNCIPIVRSASSILIVLMNSLVSDPKLKKKNQDLARSSLALLWQITLVFNSLAREQQSLSRSLVELMVEGNPESVDLFKRVFPAPFCRLLNPPALDPTKVKAAAKSNLPLIIGGEGHPTNSDKWNNFFNTLSKSYENPDLIWNENMRQELIFCIGEEIEAYDREKERGPKNRKYAWNYQEFTVPYNCLATELKVGEYYINLLLTKVSELDIRIANPADFTQRLFYRFLIETVTDSKVACLKAITWTYSKYHAAIGPINFIENVLFLLQSKVNREISGNLMLLLYEACTLNKTNFNLFIGLRGAVVLMKLLPLVHLKKQLTPIVMTVPPINPHRIGIVALRLLLEVSKTQSNLDENGFYKSPIALLKRQLSDPAHLPYLVQVLMTGSHGKNAIKSITLLSELTVQLLEYLIELNDDVASQLYKTGLFYFLLRFQELNPLPICQLLAKLHKKQANSPGESLLKRFIPEWIVSIMERESVEMFEKTLNGTKETKEFYWNKHTRNYLYDQIDKHLEEFRGKLASTGGRQVYSYTEMPPVEYPDMEYFEKIDVAEREANFQQSLNPNAHLNNTNNNANNNNNASVVAVAAAIPVPTSPVVEEKKAEPASLTITVEKPQESVGEQVEPSTPRDDSEETAIKEGTVPGKTTEDASKKEDDISSKSKRNYESDMDHVKRKNAANLKAKQSSLSEAEDGGLSDSPAIRTARTNSNSNPKRLAPIRQTAGKKGSDPRVDSEDEDILDDYAGQSYGEEEPEDGYNSSAYNNFGELSVNESEEEDPRSHRNRTTRGGNARGGSSGPNSSKSTPKLQPSPHIAVSPKGKRRFEQEELDAKAKEEEYRVKMLAMKQQQQKEEEEQQLRLRLEVEQKIAKEDQEKRIRDEMERKIREEMVQKEVLAKQEAETRARLQREEIEKKEREAREAEEKLREEIQRKVLMEYEQKKQAEEAEHRKAEEERMKREEMEKKIRLEMELKAKAAEEEKKSLSPTMATTNTNNNTTTATSGRSGETSPRPSSTAATNNDSAMERRIKEEIERKMQELKQKGAATSGLSSLFGKRS